MPSNPKWSTPTDSLSSDSKATQLDRATLSNISEDKIIFTLDGAGNFTYINAAAERLTGYSCEQARGMNVTEMLPPQLAKQIGRQLRHNLRRRFGTVYEVEVVTREGRHVALEASIDVVRQNNRCIEIQGLAIETAMDSGRNSRPRCLDQDFAFQ